MLFIGGTAGIAAHLLIPGLPEALAFTTMFAPLPGSRVAAPFSLILLGALTTQIGTLLTAPIAIAVLTAYLGSPGPAFSWRWRNGKPSLPPGREQKASGEAHAWRRTPAKLPISSPITVIR